MMNHTPSLVLAIYSIHAMFNSCKHTLWSDSQRMEVDVVDLIVCCRYGQNQCCFDNVLFRGA